MHYTIARARGSFAEIVNRAIYLKERVVVTRHGREVLALVPIEDLRRLEALEEMLDAREAMEALVEAKTEGMVSYEEMKKRLGM